MAEPTTEMITRAAEAIEDEAVRLLGHDLGVIHRDEIVAAGLRAALTGHTAVEHAPATGITDEMLKAGAHAVTDARRNYETYNDYAIAERVLWAALAGRTPVELPEPDGYDNGGPVWSMPPGASPVTIAVVAGQAFVSALGPADPVDLAEAYALRVLAGAREARRLAAESSGDVCTCTRVFDGAALAVRHHDCPAHGESSGDEPEPTHLALMDPTEVATECDCLAGEDHVGPWTGPNYESSGDGESRG